MGKSINNIKKYKKVTVCPISKKGDITGKLPIHPKRKQIKKKNQTIIPYIGLKIVLLIIKFLHINGIIITQIIKQAIKNKPNSLLGTLLSTAYKGKKYHSGIICGGVTKELAAI
jgi:hypothetical protein